MIVREFIGVNGLRLPSFTIFRGQAELSNHDMVNKSIDLARKVKGRTVKFPSPSRFILICKIEICLKRNHYYKPSQGKMKRLAWAILSGLSLSACLSSESHSGRR